MMRDLNPFTIQGDLVMFHVDGTYCFESNGSHCSHPHHTGAQMSRVEISDAMTATVGGTSFAA